MFPRAAASIGLNLLVIALLVLARAQQTEAAARLAPLTDQLRLGAEYFLNRTDTQETVRHHFQMMHKYGLRACA